jgi:hypothetical protein
VYEQAYRCRVAGRPSTPSAVAAIERAKVDASEPGTPAAYIKALGGLLEIVADFGTNAWSSAEPLPDAVVVPPRSRHRDRRATVRRHG